MNTKIRFHANPQGGGMAVVTDFWYEWDDNRPDAEQRAEAKARELNELMEKLEAVVEAARGIIHREVIGGYGYEGYQELNSALHDLAELERECATKFANSAFNMQE